MRNCVIHREVLALRKLGMMHWVGKSPGAQNREQEKRPEPELDRQD